MAFKFNEEKVKTAIDIYKDEHGNNPYLIISSETEKYLPNEYSYSSIPAYGSLFVGSSITVDSCCDHSLNCVDHTKDIKSSSDSKRTKWYNAKILIDDDLKFGEVLVK